VLGERDCEETTGLRIDEVVRYWLERRPWSGVGVEEVTASILEGVIHLVDKQGVAKPGVEVALGAARSLGLELALATSSAPPLIEATLRRLDLDGVFSVVHSAASEKWGKPHPAVYLTTAERLGVDPRRCVAFEDSINGVIAAKAARMRCIAVPDVPPSRRAPFAVADRVLESLLEVTPDLLRRLDSRAAVP